jgi:hypothetical protein
MMENIRSRIDLKKPVVFPDTSDNDIERSGIRSGAKIIPPIITATLSSKSPGVTIRVASRRRR